MNDESEILEGFVPFPPPAGLRDRILTAAATALGSEPRGRWTQVWQSAVFRLSWAAALLLLALAHALLPAVRRGGSTPVVASKVVPRNPEIGSAVALPRVDPDAEAWTVLDEKELLDRFEQPEHPPTKSSSKEKS